VGLWVQKPPAAAINLQGLYNLPFESTGLVLEGLDSEVTDREIQVDGDIEVFLEDGETGNVVSL
jgi:hypothetical protein